MAVFKKRETLLENITYMALMAAINVIFVLLTLFVPFLLFLLVFILPLSSTIVTIYCKKRYYPIYAIVTIGICMLVTVTDFADTIFFVIPSIITGFIFGVTIKVKIPSIVVIVLTTIVQILLTYPGLWLATQVLYPGQEDIFVVLANGIGINSHPYLNYIKHLCIAMISLAQEVISFIVIKEESNKVGISIEDNSWQNKLISPICIFVLSGLSLLMAFCCPELSYVFMIGSTLFAIYEIILIGYSKKYLLFFVLGSFLIGVFIFAALYSSIAEPLGFISIQIPYCCVGIIALINNYLLDGKRKDRIEKQVD